MKNYQPVGNRLIIQKPIQEKEEKTTGGIIIPKDETDPAQREKETFGTIIALGSKVDKTFDFEIGQTVKYAKHSQVELEKDIVIVKDCDVQCIVCEDDSKDDEYVTIDCGTLAEPNKTMRVKKKETL
jgi:co-chaperonin GroES (HSP10)